MSYLQRIISILIFCLYANVMSAQKATVPIPNPSQKAWQEAELTVVFHYDLHVFDGKKYSQPSNRITPIEDINIFSPEKLDTDQWIRTAKDMGAKIAILTATHETGFALYQSDVNPYCMKALKFKDGKGDIVRDFVNSCRKYGIRPGIYIGIRWNSFFGIHDFVVADDGSKFQANRQAFYNKMCEGMTRELMSRYGDLAIVWYDGGGHGPELGGPNILPIVEEYQKDIIFYHNTERADIRWGGSESGTVPYPCWGSYPFPYSHSKNQDYIFKDNFKLLKQGDPNGEYYMPAMSDAPLRGYNGRHEWFWEPGDEAHIYPLEHLIKMYNGSVGHNSTLILGLTPDENGLMPEPDAIRLKEFGDSIKRRFLSPIAIVENVKNKKELNLKNKDKEPIKDIVIQEDLTYGERVRRFTIEAKVDGKWQEIYSGSSVGHKHIIPLSGVNASQFKLKVLASIGEPMIKMFAIY